MKKLTEKQRIIIVVVIVVLLMIAAFVIFKVGAARNVEYFYLQYVDENGFGALRKRGACVFPLPERLR